MDNNLELSSSSSSGLKPSAERERIDLSSPSVSSKGSLSAGSPSKSLCSSTSTSSENMHTSFDTKVTKSASCNNLYYLLVCLLVGPILKLLFSRFFCKLFQPLRDATKAIQNEECPLLEGETMKGRGVPPMSKIQFKL